ncbi:MAG: hypothetical protein QM532_00435 [Cyanobium sp. MAG06]|nr:hypothetical protein [Cyanobium sp. MAG06]
MLKPNPFCKKIIIPQIENRTNNPIILHINFSLASFIAAPPEPADLFFKNITTAHIKNATAMVINNPERVSPIRSVISSKKVLIVSPTAAEATEIIFINIKDNIVIFFFIYLYYNIDY